MLFFQWLVILVCSMVSVIAAPLLVASRVCDSSPDDPGNSGMRRTVFWIGSLADTTAAVFAGALLGVWWLPALTAGLLFFLGKVGLSEIWAARVGRKGVVKERSEEDERRDLDYGRRAAEAIPPAAARKGVAKLAGIALLQVMVLLLFLLPFRLWLPW